MKSHRKPIGETGPIQVTNTSGDPLVTWLTVQFPDDKAAQEMVIASTFVKELNSKENAHWTVEQLEENNFDFAMHSSEGRRYLELQEIVIPPAKRGSPYSSRQQVIRAGKFADTIVTAIGRKAAKYPRSQATSLDLLLYATHWRFLPSQSVTKLIAHHLRNVSHPFANVWQLTLSEQGTGSIERLFPNEQLLNGFSPMEAKIRRYVNIDPATRYTVKRTDGSIGVGFTLNSEATRKLLRQWRG